MIIYKPHWVAHTDEKGRKLNIFTIAINPSSTKLATGSQDPEIKIWNVNALLSEASGNVVQAQAEPSTRTPSLLSSLKHHNGSIMCLRWSPLGTYLASASDDKSVIIWSLEKQAVPVKNEDYLPLDDAYNPFEKFCIERYKIVKRLLSHQSDVTGLDWSPDQKCIASCGLDNMIYVWETKTFTCVKALNAHQGHIKGIAWDPVGHFLASHSDDGSLIIWRTSTWNIENQIFESFHEFSGATYFQRPSWSPDGSYLAAANACNAHLPICALIQRPTALLKGSSVLPLEDNMDHEEGQWRCQLGLIGHEEPIEVASFNPMIFHTSENGHIGNDQNEKTLYCAIAGQDKSLSLWRTDSPRPVFVIQELFSHSVLDLAWNKEGDCLFAASYEGSIACIIFEESELGIAVSKGSKLKMLEKYGPSMDDIDLPSNVAEYSQKERENMAEPSNESTRTTTDGPSRHVMDRPIKTNDALKDSCSVAYSDVLKTQKVTITKDGKKRIQPQLLHARSAPQKEDPPVEEAPSGGEEEPSASQVEEKDTQSHRHNLRHPKKDKIKSGERSTKKGTSELEHETFQKSQNSCPLKPPLAPAKLFYSISLKESPPPGTIIGSSILASSAMACSMIVEVLNRPSMSQVALVKDDSVEWKLTIPFPVSIIRGNGQLILICSATSNTILLLSTQSGRRMTLPWILDSKVCLVSEIKGSKIALVTSRGQFYYFDLKHMKSCMDADNVYIQSILHVEREEGTMDESNAQQFISTIQLVGGSPLCGDKADEQAQWVPMVTTLNRHHYIYHLQLKIWMRMTSLLDSSEFALSDFYFGSDENENAHKSGAGNQTHRANLEGMREKFFNLSENDKARKRMTSIVHIEHQLAAAKLLGDKHSYVNWLRIYAKRLADERATCKIKELCDDLMGPRLIHHQHGTLQALDFFDAYVGTTTSAPSSERPDAQKRYPVDWEPMIMGVSKYQLFKEIISILSSNCELSELLETYKPVS